MSRNLIIQMLQWNLKSITEHLPIISQQGFNMIQTSPLQGIKEEDNYKYWALYQPLGIRIIDSKQIGTKNDLINLCKEADKYNIKICVDVVLRHVASDNKNLSKPHEKVDKILTNNKSFFTNANNTTNYDDRWQLTNLATGMPMLDYKNEELQEICKQYIMELKECGVKSIRLDQCKHFSTSKEGCNFFENVFGEFKDMFIYGECINTPKELLDDYVADGINVFTDYHLPSDKTKGVIAIETHDTFNCFKSTLHKNTDMLVNEWKFMLDNNRESSVLWYCRPFDDTWKRLDVKYINKLI